MLRLGFGAWVGMLALGACTIPAPKVDENAVPPDYRQKIVEFLHGQLPDPTGVRDAFIAEPALRTISPGIQRMVVCVKLNPKDDRGRYTGSKEMAGIYHARQLSHLVPATRELCGGASYQPFPELEKLCREIRCPT